MPKSEPLAIAYDPGERTRPDLLHKMADRGEITLIKAVLNVGDYTLVGHKDELFMETKWSMNDLAGSMSGDRPRFERELQRAWAHKAKHLITVGSFEDMEHENYRALFHPNSFVQTFLQWQQKYGFVPHFVASHAKGQLRIIECCTAFQRMLDRGVIGREPQPWRYLLDSARWVIKTAPGTFDDTTERIRVNGEWQYRIPAEEHANAETQLGVAAEALLGRRGTK